MELILRGWYWKEDLGSLIQDAIHTHIQSEEYLFLCFTPSPLTYLCELINLGPTNRKKSLRIKETFKGNVKK